MSNTILVGAQWGDEGKGKIIDFMTEQADIVARAQGGANAGHTVIVGKTQYILHLIPSGILRKRTTCVIGNGVVVDPIGLVEEIDGLLKAGIDPKGRLHVSDAAHMVFPYHKALDAAREAELRDRPPVHGADDAIADDENVAAARQLRACIRRVHPNHV